MAAGVLTMPRLILGQALKRLRAESGKTLDDAARVVGKSRARMINVLDGKATLTAQELELLLNFLDATPNQTRELLALAVEARKRPARRPFADQVPASFQRLVEVESIATEICCYERGVVPGLLQVPDYVEALMAEGDGIWWEEPTWQVRHDRIIFRLERQKLIMEAEPAKPMRFVITDDALRTEVGGPEIMKRQLEYLLSLMDERPNITIQVLASTTPHNPAPNAGLILLRLGEEHHPVGFLPVLYGPSTYLDDPVDTNRLSRAFDKIQELAMIPADSRHFVADLLKRDPSR